MDNKTKSKKTELSCELCLFFYKVNKERHCKLKRCCCIEERRAAGYTKKENIIHGNQVE